MYRDEELFVRIQKGDKASLEALVNRYHPIIFRFIYRITSDYHLAEDLSQEVFVKLIKFKNQYKSNKPFKTWIFTIASNTCKDYYKSSYYKHNIKSDDIDNVEIEDNSMNVTDIFEYRLQHKEVMERIQSLPLELKKVIILRFYEDLKLEEIAEVLGIPPGTVKTRLYSGLKRLKGQAEQYRREEVSHVK